MPHAKTNPPSEEIFQALYLAWGPQHWWPARSRFEMMIGAVLTQNTAWTHVERAIANLRKARVLNPRTVHAMPAHELAALIRPAGYFNVKARRIKHLADWLMTRFRGSLQKMRGLDTPLLRDQLLAVYGIGKETADSILLYALKRPVFVVDAYTRRFMVRHGWLEGEEPYDEVAAILSRPLKRRPAAERVAVYNEFHALIVALAKRHCRSKPDCTSCPLKPWLP